MPFFFRRIVPTFVLTSTLVLLAGCGCQEGNDDDTVTPEPLPEGHWLYTHPGVRLSPHVSWSMPGAMDGLVDPFIENLGRWQEGLPLIDQVDVEEGY